LIFAGPGIPAGQRRDAMVYLPSLFATSCEMAGVKPPATVEFPSLVPLIEGRQGTLHDDIYAGFINLQRMVRTDRWKLTITPGAGVVQLFDVREDPWELHNLAGDPSRRDVVADLSARLHSWMDKTGDPLPWASVNATLEANGKDR
jgi:arylsulfatase A-like enzyme